MSDNDTNPRATATKITDLDVASIKERVPGTDDGKGRVWGLESATLCANPVERIRIPDY